MPFTLFVSNLVCKCFNENCQVLNVFHKVLDLSHFDTLSLIMYRVARIPALFNFSSQFYDEGYFIEIILLDLKRCGSYMFEVNLVLVKIWYKIK